MPSDIHPRIGQFVLVVGPSGAGKDSLLAIAKDYFRDEERVLFVTRTITRPPSVGEDHRPVSIEEFARLMCTGAFTLHWEAHGLNYGLPSEIEQKLTQGQVVIANGSRATLDAAVEKFPHMRVISITARPEILAARLEGRGRELRSARDARMARSDDIKPYSGDVFTIDNSGAIELGAERLLGYISDLLSGVSPENG